MTTGTAYRSCFLDAPSHLYKRVCPSVRMSVGPSVTIKGNAVYRVLGASYVGYPALLTRKTIRKKNPKNPNTNPGRCEWSASKGMLLRRINFTQTRFLGAPLHHCRYEVCTKVRPYREKKTGHIRHSKRTRYRPTNGRTRPLIEMRSCI